jgi:hypothetical protein
MRGSRLSRKRSRDASAPRRRQRLSPVVSYSRTGSQWLGDRPRTSPDRVKWRAPASLRRTLSVDFCNDYDARARPRASDPRPRRREGVLRPCLRVGLRFPRGLSAPRRAIALPPFRRESRQRATPHPGRRPLEAQDRQGMERRRPPLFRSVACEATSRARRRLHRGRVRQWRCACRGSIRPE